MPQPFRFFNPLPTQTAPLPNLLLPKQALVVAVALATAEHHRSCYHWSLRDKWRNVARCRGECKVIISGKHMGNNKGKRETPNYISTKCAIHPFGFFHKKNIGLLSKSSIIPPIFPTIPSLISEKNCLSTNQQPQGGATCAAFHHALWEATRRL